GQARLSRTLVTLDRAVPLPAPLAELGVRPTDGPRALAFCKAMEFAALAKRVAAATGAETDGIEAASITVRYWEAPDVAPAAVPSGADGFTPAALASARTAQEQARTVDPAAYAIAASLEAVAGVLARAAETGVLALAPILAPP